MGGREDRRRDMGFWGVDTTKGGKRDLRPPDSKDKGREEETQFIDVCYLR